MTEPLASSRPPSSAARQPAVSPAPRRRAAARSRTAAAAPQTRAERVAAGKAARVTVSRARQGGWGAPDGRIDPVDMLLEQESDRVPELLAIRHGRMLASPLAFYRGSAAVMAADLASRPSSGLRVQLCGDAHLTNFGGYAAPDRTMVFDLNDFDETLPGPWEWDVKRLVTSFAIAGRDRRFNLDERRLLTLGTARAYRSAVREFAGMTNLSVWYSRMNGAELARRWGADVSPETVATFQRRVAKAMTKDSARAQARLSERVDGRLRIRSDPPLLVPIGELLGDVDLTPFERAIRTAIRTYSRSLPGDRRALLEQYRFVDLGRKVVGVGSVGTRAWVVLLQGVDDGDPLVLQLKEARESVLAPYAGRSRYPNEGQRVVEGQRLMQAASDIFLGWSRGPAIDGTARDFYVRQLWDWKMSADLEKTTLETLSIFGKICGWTLARAHARSGDRVALAAYLGRGTSFDLSMAEFAESYADQNEQDYEVLLAAAESGRIEVQTGV